MANEKNLEAGKSTQFKAGNPGRRKGAVNKTTRDVREAVAMLVQKKFGKLERWIDRVAAVDPEKAADILLRLMEYHIPKLGRTEVTGAGGAPISPPVINIGFANGGPGDVAKP